MNICVEFLDSQVPETKEIIKREVISLEQIISLGSETFQNFQEQKSTKQCLSFPSSRKIQWSYLRELAGLFTI